MKPLGAYPFTPEFQQRIIALCLSDRLFFARQARALDAGYFTAPGLADLFRLVADHHRRYREVPSRGMFLDVAAADGARRRLKPAAAEAELEQARAIAAAPADDLAYVAEKLADWAKTQVIAQTAMTLAKLYERSQATGQAETDEMMRAMHEAMAAVAPPSEGLDQLEYFDDLVPRIYSDHNVHRIPTGYESLDARLEGGIDRGELFVFLAPPSGGKTTFLVGLARAALMRSMKVLVVTCEVSPRRWAGRVDRAITGRTRRQILEDPRRWARAIRRVKQVSGKMFIKGFPSGSATVGDVDAAIDALRDAEGFEPDLLIVDYADELRSERFKDDYRLGVIDVYRGLRAIAQRRAIPAATASQAGQQAEGKRIVTMKDAAEAYGKNAVADIVIGICQTEEEAAARPPICRLYGAKYREGERRFMIHYEFNPERGVIAPAEPRDAGKAPVTVVRYKQGSGGAQS